MHAFQFNVNVTPVSHCRACSNAVVSDQCATMHY